MVSQPLRAEGLQAAGWIRAGERTTGAVLGILCHVLVAVSGKQELLGFPEQHREHSGKVGNVPPSLQQSPHSWQSGGRDQVAKGP